MKKWEARLGFFLRKFWDKNSKTIYIKKSDYDMHSEPCIYQGSAGPYGNLTGMREKYWGMDSIVVKQGAYLYYIGRQTYCKHYYELTGPVDED